MVWDKGFEAVRDTPGICVDKHCGNASPLRCLSFNVALRVFFHAERPMHMNSRKPLRFDICACNAARPSNGELDPAKLLDDPDFRRSVFEYYVLERLEISKNC